MFRTKFKNNFFTRFYQAHKTSIEFGKTEKNKFSSIIKQLPSQLITDVQRLCQRLDDTYLDYAASFTYSEQEALHQYQGVDYSPINRYLRHPCFINTLRDNPVRMEDILTAIIHLDAVIKRCQTPVAMTVYRSQHIDKRLCYPASLVGTVINEPAYMSTSVFKNKADALLSTEHDEASPNHIPALFEIAIPQGTMAMWMDAIEDIGEGELLLPRGGKLFIEALEEIKEASEKTRDKVEIKASWIK